MHMLPDLDLIREVPAGVELRSTDDASLGTLVVRFSPFGKWYRVSSMWEGDFMERTQRGAFAKTIAEAGSSVRCLFNHGRDPQIGDKVLGAITDLREAKDSPVADVDLFDTTYNRDLLPGLQAGQYGSSFRMRVIKDEWNDEPKASAANPDRLPERTITEVRLYEMGPVTFPANPAATAAVRSATDEYYQQLRARDPETYGALVARAAALRGPGAAPGTPAADGAAPAGPDEPARSHSGGMGPRERRAALHPYLNRS